MSCNNRDPLSGDDVGRVRRLEEEIFGRVSEISRIMRRRDQLGGARASEIASFTVTPRGASDLDPNVAQIEVIFKDGSAGCVKDPPGVSCNTTCDNC